MVSQLDRQGNLRHLLTLEGISASCIHALLDRAETYLTGPGDAPARGADLRGRAVAMLFFEPSTRTRISFELATTRLGGDALNLDLRSSSRAKGESMLDTLHTLTAMQVDFFVVRDAQPGVPRFLAEHAAPHVSILNAGEGMLAHPTQGLLDVLTIRRHKRSFEDLTVTIVGDIAHSRVARSAVQALHTLGTRCVRLVAPPELAFDPGEFPLADCGDDIDAALTDADVVMALRIQRERMEGASIPDSDAYFRHYGLTPKRLALARRDAIVMHPGPMNREVEIASEVADGAQSVIAEQVTLGVAVRMAILAEMHESHLNAESRHG